MENFLKKLKISESTFSLVLGVLVVLAVAALAYNFFKVKSATAPAVQKTEIAKGAEFTGELTAPTAGVSLPTEHTVMPGETLWVIAEKYYRSGYNWVDVAKVNELRNANWIMVGQKLTIPNAAVRQAASKSTVVLTPAVMTSKIEGDRYTVIRGDSLWTISVRAYGDGFRWGEIVKANNLVRPRLIHAGNVLVLPRP